MSAAKNLLLAKLKQEESEKQHEATLRLQQQETIIKEKWHQTKMERKQQEKLKLNLTVKSKSFVYEWKRIDSKWNGSAKKNELK